MTVPSYSVVIPAYNEARPLARLLDALARSTFRDFEIIVVSDASEDGTDAVAESAGARLLRNARRSGPGVSRNRGARAARAPFLVFLDADVVPGPDTLAQIDENVRSGVRCFTGVYASTPAVDSPFQRYRALLSQSYVEGLPRRSSSTLFVTAVAGLERDLFEAAGGFDESNRASGAEDTAFGYQLLQRATIYLLCDVTVQHEFPGFATTFRNYYQRSAAWVGLFRSRRSFDTNTTTGRTAALRLLGASVALLTAGALVSPWVWPLALAAHGVYLMSNRRLMALLARHCLARELPVLYAADVCLGLAVLGGAVKGALHAALSPRAGAR